MTPRTPFMATALLLALSTIAQTSGGTFLSSANAWNLDIRSQSISSDGFIYYTGRLRDSVSDHVYLSKSDTSGNMIWEKKLGDYLEPNAICANSSGFYIAGTEGFFGFVMRFDANGILLWQKNIPDVMSGGEVQVRDVITRNDGGCVIAGDYDNSNSTGNYRSGFIARFDSNGTILWNNEINWKGWFLTYVRDLATDDANNLYICGSIWGGPGVQRALLTKFNDSGNMLWAHDYTDTAGYLQFNQCVIISGEIVASGIWLSNSSIGYKGILTRLDTSGYWENTVVFHDTLPYSVHNIAHICPTPFNTIVLAGYTGYAQYNQSMLMELDLNFNIIRAIYNADCHSLTGVELFQSRVYLCGWKDSNSSYFKSDRAISDYNWDFGCGFSSLNATVAPKTLAQSNLLDSFLVIQATDSFSLSTSINVSYETCDNLAGVPDPPVFSSFTLFPNPANQFCTILFAEPLPESCVFTITDSEGRPVRVCFCETGTTQIDINTADLSGGTYFLNSDSQFSGKIVVDH